MKKLLIGTIACLSLILLYQLNKTLTESQLRDKLDDSVVYVVNDQGNSGGTGFLLENSSGRKFIVTNSHVCKHVQKDGIVNVKYKQQGPVLKRRVIEIARNTDLCLIESVDGMPALKMANNYQEGDKIYVLGHPYLQPLTFVSGEIVGKDIVSIIDFLYTPENADKECEGVKMPVQFFILEAIGCVIQYEALTTTVVIFSGNSGSPVSDIDGNVVGVVFAANGVDHWGKAIPLEQLEEFINKY